LSRLAVGQAKASYRVAVGQHGAGLLLPCAARSAAGLLDERPACWPGLLLPHLSSLPAADACFFDERSAQLVQQPAKPLACCACAAQPA